MAFVVPVSVERTFELAASPAEAYALLADLPAWQPLFPFAERCEPLGGFGPDVFRWELAPMGPPGTSVGTVYACRYTFEPPSASGPARIAWTPVEGVGTALLSGSLVLSPLSTGAPYPSTQADLVLDAHLTLPLPRLMRAVVAPGVRLTFGEVVRQFAANVAEALR